MNKSEQKAKENFISSEFEKLCYTQKEKVKLLKSWNVCEVKTVLGREGQTYS